MKFFKIFLIVIVSILSRYALGMNNDDQPKVEDEIKQTRLIGNILDPLCFTTIAQLFDTFVSQNSEIELTKNSLIGVGSWLTGELVETVYKKLYKIQTKKNLRKTLGTTDLFGLEIDNQRLLRRSVSMLTLFLCLYFS